MTAPGQIVVLNGAPRAGKSSIVAVVQLLVATIRARLVSGEPFTAFPRLTERVTSSTM